MKILPGYCKEMAHYNAWQNRQLRDSFQSLSEAELRRDRAAFFGSIFKTANHLLWGDEMWFSRFTNSEPPQVTIDESPDRFDTIGEYLIERFRLDSRISLWAEGLKAVDLQGELTWYSAVKKSHLSMPLQDCIVHFFNHQTHHRGQLSTLLSQLGIDIGVTDLLAIIPDGE